MNDIGNIIFYLSPLVVLALFLIISSLRKSEGSETKNPFASIALGLSMYPLFFTAFKAATFNTAGGTQFAIDSWWMESFGISFRFGMDGISMLLVLLTNFLVPLIILTTFNREIKSPKAFYALIFLMQFALVGVFSSFDAFLFYIFWELALIPIYFICLLWGGHDRIRITLKFFIYTLTGSLFMLVGLIYLYLQTPGTHSFAIEEFYKLNLSATEQSWLFWAFFLAFAIKMPVFPFHTWQPDTYTDAPTQGTMLLSGIMLKMGVYGVIRWMIPVIPGGVMEWSHTAVLLSVIGIVYASCMALVQKDFKRLIAYSSIAHVGLISAGVFALNAQGLQGSIIQMISHGVNVVGLFLIADILFDRFKTRNIDELGGIANGQSLFSILFVMIMLGSVALPLTNGFVGEFLLLNGVYKYDPIYGIFAGLTIILGAVYMLRSYQSIMLGDKMGFAKDFGGMQSQEKVVLSIIVIVIIVTGIFPQWMINISEPAVKEILTHVKY